MRSDLVYTDLCSDLRFGDVCSDLVFGDGRSILLQTMRSKILYSFSWLIVVADGRDFGCLTQCMNSNLKLDAIKKSVVLSSLRLL